MGVKDLWKVLRPAASTESVTRLAVDGFNANSNGNRGIRVGIDASIWLGHTQKIKNRSKMGKNFTLRNLFFRCAHMLEVPLLPLFVFDSKGKPLMKRGRVSHFKKSKLVEDMQELLDAFGFLWHPAPGEAEAELAYLNSIGVIDVVWTDDVDVFLFGATKVIRSPSNTLSGNATDPILNAEGRDDSNHVMVLSAHDLESHPEVHLTRASLILIALLRGGDYDEGVPQIGMQIAYGLARCGFGDSLLKGIESLRGKELRTFLTGWRDAIVSELHSDSQGFLRKKHAKLARSFPTDFPKLEVLTAYTSPVVTNKDTSPLAFDWDLKLDLSALAAICKRSLGWDDDTVLQRFRSLVWPGAVMRVLRDAVISSERTTESQSTGHGAPAGSTTSTRAGQAAPSLVASVLVRLRGRREDASTDYLPELQIEINPAWFVQATRNGLSSSHPPSQGHLPARSTKSVLATDNATLRIWLPVCIVQLVSPQLASAPELSRATRRATKRRRGSDPTSDSDAGTGGAQPGSQKTTRTNTGRVLPRDHDDSPSKRAHNAVIDLASASDGDVIVISDSDDARDNVDKRARVPGVVIDLT